MLCKKCAEEIFENDESWLCRKCHKRMKKYLSGRGYRKEDMTTDNMQTFEVMYIDLDNDISWKESEEEHNIEPLSRE